MPVFLLAVHFHGGRLAMGFGGVQGHWDGGLGLSPLQNDTQLDSYGRMGYPGGRWR